jgi:hypothetical protein
VPAADSSPPGARSPWAAGSATVGRMPLIAIQTDLGQPDPGVVGEAKMALSGPGIVILRGSVEPEAATAARRAIERDLCGLNADAARRCSSLCTNGNHPTLGSRWGYREHRGAASGTRDGDARPLDSEASWLDRLVLGARRRRAH